MIKENYELKKYAIFWEQHELAKRMFENTLKILINPKTFNEIFQICNEFIKRKDEFSNSTMQFLPILKTPEILEGISLIYKFEMQKKYKANIKKSIMNFFQRNAIKNQYFWDLANFKRKILKDQYSWIQSRYNFYYVINNSSSYGEISENLSKHILSPTNISEKYILDKIPYFLLLTIKSEYNHEETIKITENLLKTKITKSEITKVTNILLDQSSKTNKNEDIVKTANILLQNGLIN